MCPDEYLTLRLPRTLVDEIDKIVNQGLLGFRSRAEFVADAVRRRLEEVWPLGEER